MEDHIEREAATEEAIAKTKSELGDSQAEEEAKKKVQAAQEEADNKVKLAEETAEKAIKEAN
jgi:hypothetical protein